jgi:Rrf2 family protein
MLFSTPAEYAIRGVAELACKSPDQYMLLDELVQGTDLPRDFMAKVFQRLVKGDVLKSVKGRNGGFTLARRPSEITLMNIIEAVEGPQPLDSCVVGFAQCHDAMPCAQHDLYKPIRQRLKDYMHKTTVADLAASLKSKKSWQQAQSAAAK